MCAICSQLKNGQMTWVEAQRNLQELQITSSKPFQQHLHQVEELIEAKEYQELRFLEIHCAGGD